MGKIPHYLRIIRQLYFQEKLSLILSTLKAKYWGVELGKESSFFGTPKFRKTPGSIIKIGEKARILSAFSSNLHGLNRKTMFSCLTKQSTLIIGNDFGASGLVVACAKSIKIGDRVMIGANTTISDTDSHAINYKYRHPKHFGLANPDFTEPIQTKEVVIEDDVFIGMHSLILKGAHIGKGSVIGAGSIVTGYIPPNVIAAGQPAKVIKEIVCDL